MTIKAVILAGGSGARLWPLSRADYPKQFLAFNGETTMLQETCKRLDTLDIQSSVIVCNEAHRFLVAEQLLQIKKLATIILEPVSRNTAPSIALAALSLLGDEDDPLLLVLSADHVIQDEVAFAEAVTKGISIAESGKIVTFGVKAYEPNTGYGYIKKGDSVGNGFVVDKFIEKPSIEVATKYLESDDYLWNSGMFLFKASRFIEELKKHNPDIYKACYLSVKDISKDHDFLRINQAAFTTSPSESIDYAVIEKIDDAIVIPMDAGWSDIGSWSALWNISKKDCKGNVTFGDTLLYESHNSYIRTDNQLIAAIGVNDLVIISTKDALVVSHKGHVQDVKAIVQHLKDNSRPEWKHHREVFRPWGKFDSIDKGKFYQVKRITVKPGAKLSVQMHQHRAEHWVVVSGTARVTNGDKTFILSENESTYIPLGVIHSLENPGNVPLEIIEIQTGSYLGEDDILRIDDIYGRAKSEYEIEP